METQGGRRLRSVLCFDVDVRFFSLTSRRFSSPRRPPPSILSTPLSKKGTINNTKPMEIPAKNKKKKTTSFLHLSIYIHLSVSIYLQVSGRMQLDKSCVCMREERRKSLGGFWRTLSTVQTKESLSLSSLLSLSFYFSSFSLSSLSLVFLFFLPFGCFPLTSTSVCLSLSLPPLDFLLTSVSISLFLSPFLLLYSLFS